MFRSVSLNPFAVVSSSLREMMQYRELFLNLIARELRARYKGSRLGFVWSLLNPLMMMVVYTAIFSVVMRIPIENYSLYLFLGLLPWTWFSTALSNSATSVVSNASLIRKVYFPSELLPLVAVASTMVNYLLALPILIAFLLWNQIPFTWVVLLFPVIVAIQFMVTLGFSLLLAAINVFFRDIEQLLGILILVWMYLTPILYAPDMIPEPYRWIYYLNPMAPVIHAYHQVFLYGTLPDLAALLYAGSVGVLLVFVGLLVFSLVKFEFAEVV